ncbi:hypothetical protein P7C70_g2810, partial [Phenoliferia sp. Uapishka_3]
MTSVASPSEEKQCSVCTSPAAFQCSRCKSLPLCSEAHQRLLWGTHKQICKANTPLEFHQPPLTRAQFDDFFFGVDATEPDAVFFGRFLQLRHATTSGDLGDLVFPRAMLDSEPGLNMPLEASVDPLWHHLQQTLAKTPREGQDVIVGWARGSFATDLLRVRGSLHIGPITRLSMLLYTREEDRGYLNTSLPTSRLASLPPALKNSFQLQALILTTLSSCEKTKIDFVKLALERLRTIAGDEVPEVIAAFASHVAEVVQKEDKKVKDSEID